jgi:hypothetical protein
MITEWYYDGRDTSIARQKVKEIILSKNYSSIDVGASIYFWSYPECKTVADITPVHIFLQNGKSDIKNFELNLQDEKTYKELLDYVAINGKFDFSICSHTLEDIYNPYIVINLLEKISKKGFIAIPSKYDELTHLYGNFYRGNSHHKFIFTIKNNVLQILPKLSFIEKHPQSDEIIKKHKGIQLSIFWEEKIEFELFGETPFSSDSHLIDTYFNILNHEEENKNI